MREFNKLVQEWGLRYSPLSNARYTWTNGQENLIMCRLDRFMMSRDWEDWYPHFFQEALPKVVSDHWSVVLLHYKVKFWA